jgi:CubicO group peptidase (beta-lactamase class C family)
MELVLSIKGLLENGCGREQICTFYGRSITKRSIKPLDFMSTKNNRKESMISESKKLTPPNNRIEVKPLIFLLLIFFLTTCTNNPGKTKQEKIDFLLQKSFEDKEFVGNVLVAEKGRIILKKSLGRADYASNVENTDSTRFLIASISKPITAVLILRLVDKKIIRLDDKVSKYFNVSDQKTGSISIHQLLTHTSGVTEFINKEKNIELASLLEKASFNFEPGTDFEYSNSGYVLLKAIAEAATKRTYSQLVKEEIFDIVEMTSSGIARDSNITAFAKGYQDATQAQAVAVDFPLENIDGAGSVYSTVEDLYKLDRALYTESIISNEMKENLLKQHVPEKYSYGWFVRERGGVWDVYWQKGNLPGFTTYISRSVQKDQFVVLLANAEDLDLESIENKIARILKTSE